jgi:hypothetical protein
VSKFSRLKKYCGLHRIKVQEVPSKRLSDYSAMNYSVAKIIGFPRIKPNEIIIEESNKSERKYRDLKHELVERNLMKKKHLHYWQAHLKATKAEKKPYKGY